MPLLPATFFLVQKSKIDTAWHGGLAAAATKVFHQTPGPGQWEWQKMPLKMEHVEEEAWGAGVFRDCLSFVCITEWPTEVFFFFFN